MSALNIVIIGRIHPSGPELLAERDDLVVTQIDQEPQTVAAHMTAADAVIVRTAKLSADVLAGANRLQMVARHGVGYDNVDVAALTARGIPLATVGDANSLAVAEHALHFMLMLAKRAMQWHGTTSIGDWQGTGLSFGADLQGKTVFIVGLGRIGTHAARLCRAFGMDVLVHDPYVDDAKIAASDATRTASFEAGLAAADFTTLHAPLTDETRAMIDAPALDAMPDHAYLINVSRGGLVDEAALTRALKNRAIAGAGIDVFEQEPPAAGNPLLALDTVVLSPHVAGITAECLERMSRRCAQNVMDFIDGKLDPSVVINPEALTKK